MHDQSIQTAYDPLLVTLSFLVSVLGSYTALQLGIGISSARTRMEGFRTVLLAGSAMGGGAIWAMHFIAMLALKMNMAVTYNIEITVLSIIMAIVACVIGLTVVGFGIFSNVKLVIGGFIMGLGVAGMHYTGMAAMQMAATTHYDMVIVAISVVIAVVASIAALWLAFHMRGALPMLGSAVVMGIAVCGMHYTGMLAATFKAVKGMQVPVGGLSGTYLGAAVFVITTLLLAGLLVVSILREQKRQLVKI